MEEQKNSLQEQNSAREAELAALAEQGEQQSKELSGLRNRTTLSQQNFSKEREDLLQREAYAKEEFEAAKQAMQDWEILAMEERSIRESIAEKVADLDEQVTYHREAHERAASERDSQSSTVDGLQRALQELQDGMSCCPSSDVSTENLNSSKTRVAGAGRKFTIPGREPPATTTSERKQGYGSHEKRRLDSRRIRKSSSVRKGGERKEPPNWQITARSCDSK